MHEAKRQLSKLVAAVSSGAEREVVIAINGAAAARLVPIEEKPRPRWGLLKGKITVPDNIDASADEIERLFAGRNS